MTGKQTSRKLLALTTAMAATAELAGNSGRDKLLGGKGKDTSSSDATGIVKSIEIAL